jgi:hypothetical protein
MQASRSYASTASKAGNIILRTALCTNYLCTYANKIHLYSAALLSVFTNKIKRKEVGIIIKSAVAIKPKMLTSILVLFY